MNKYRLNSEEEPTDEMLFNLMAEIAAAARESSERAERENRRRLKSIAHEIKIWRQTQGV